jgi:hypothetical protein
VSIAALLARAKAQAAALLDGPDQEAADPTFPAGARVELEAGGFFTRGRVAFVADGWVVWCEDESADIHASRPWALRRLS